MRVTVPGNAIASAAPFGVRSISEGLDRLPGARLLDLRESDRFAEGHAAGAGRIPASEFDERRMELPALSDPVLLLHDQPEAAHAAAARLGQLGYARVAWLDGALASDPHGIVSREPPARLWSPSAFLERVHDALPQDGLPKDGLPNHGRPKGRALDVACGTGRASVFLAQAGWQVEGWDHDASALTRARAFAAREQMSITFREVDLEAAMPPEHPGAYALIVVLRYLHRPLFPWFERSLAPGGALVCETFRLGQERFGHPRRPRFLLEPGELARSFPSLTVELHEETPDSSPPVLSRILARRPG